jgi:16S rRNA (guanine527-N7)-methyltransferase
MYRDLILQGSQRFNLTALRDAEKVDTRHFLESLALGQLLSDEDLLAGGSRVLDIGSGAGLPGLPLKLLRPDLRVSLLEANGKRCAFLREVIAALALDGVVVLEGRAEDFGHDPSLREQFDLVVARAVAPLPVLLEYALPFLRLAGYLAATKGSAVDEELAAAGKALSTLGGALRRTLPLRVPGVMDQTLVVVEKEAATPERYPRRPGMPSKRPLV